MSSSSPADTTVTDTRGVPLCELRDIKVAFGGLHAVDGVTVDLYRAARSSAVGGNGAGKSTLIHTLSGAHPADAGEVRINGQTVVIHNRATPATTA